MNSIRGRLTLALLLCIVLSWMTWLCWQAMQMNREQTGLWDASLRDIGTQVLRSMPDSVIQLPNAPTQPQLSRYKDGKMSFQVWVDGRNVVHSPAAPAGPLKPDFRDGFGTHRIGDDIWRVYSITDRRRGIVAQVGRTQATLNRELHNLKRLSLAVAALIFSLLGLMIWVVVRWSLAPVTALHDSLLTRRPLDLTPLPTEAMPTEVRPLVDSFNKLLARVDAAVQNERRFTADAAHELRTPLAVLAAHADVALRATTIEEKDAALRRLSSGVQRSARLSEQLLDLARLDAGASTEGFGQVDLSELVVLVVRDFEALARDRGQHISLQTEPGAILGDIDQLGILLRNVIDNAVCYAGEGGQIAVSCRPGRSNDIRGMRLEVADDGPGVAEEDRARIFDRFYRAPRSTGRGSGIGLSLVAQIAQSHGASVEVGTGLKGRGFAISVFFAAAVAEHQATAYGRQINWTPLSAELDNGASLDRREPGL
ncbi:ATP-binding protein [Pseudoxanthomonas sacheonensis]|uniref:ATP-binding protein n=1 Tax=Pseudoxanthomonas sacheonensis TaxID=443615 RepID=UPI0013D73FD1|nr:ATP-binding protein [Pseudoxanthomonas sacheonensis]KAF1707076.1 two-component sensor histidine kinase [Pseudoxanthomonas sacheonensis]